MSTVTQEPTKVRETNPRNYLSPDVNIFESKDGYVLQAEMPGVGRDGLEVTLEGHELVIEGHRNQETVQGETLYRESRRLDYRRAFELDPTIDTSRIEAKIDQGLLTLRLPKQEKVKPRKIEVTG